MNRIVNVARMQLISKWTYLGIPGVILGSSFLVSLAIWALIPNEVEVKYSGAGQSVMWYFLALGIQSLTLTFPFSQGLSISRRTFFLGTLGLFSVAALALSVLYYLLGLVETATGGWGLKGRMFNIPWISDGAWYQPVAFVFVAAVLLFMIGFWMATLYKRWQVTGVLAVIIAVVAVLLGLAALFTWAGTWPAVGSWFVGQTPLRISGYGFILCLALAGGSYLTLRRATP